MNIRHLEYMVETVRCGSYAAASQRLSVTPRAVSKAMEELEQELGVTLFTKGSKGVVPTAFAVQFSDRAENVLFNFDQLCEFAKMYHDPSSDVKEQVRLGIAASYLRGRCCELDVVKAIVDDQPDVSCDIRLAENGVCLAALFTGRIDAAMVVGGCRHVGYTATKLFTYRPQVLMSCSSPLAHASFVRLQDLVSCRIAAPFDFVEFEDIVSARVKGLKDSFQFVDVEPELHAHQAFIDEGGLVLVSPAPRIAKMYRDAVLVPLAPDVGIEVPVYFMYAKEHRLSDSLNEMRSSLVGHLPSDGYFS